jgi:hypothetical protein
VGTAEHKHEYRPLKPETEDSSNHTHPVKNPDETMPILSHKHRMPNWDGNVQLQAPYQTLYTGNAEEISDAEAAADLQEYRKQRET